MTAGGGPPAGPEQCHQEVCLTCSDQATPARVRELRPSGMALVDTEAGPVEVSVALVAASPGDMVLVHAGEALAAWRDEGSGGGA